SVFLLLRRRPPISRLFPYHDALPIFGPEHSWLRDTGRVKYVPILDDEALEAFKLTTKLEGIIPALESAHAIAQAVKTAPTMGKRSEEHTSELQSRENLVCRLLLEKKK